MSKKNYLKKLIEEFDSMENQNLFLLNRIFVLSKELKINFSCRYNRQEQKYFFKKNNSSC